MDGWVGGLIPPKSVQDGDLTIRVQKNPMKTRTDESSLQKKKAMLFMSMHTEREVHLLS